MKLQGKIKKGGNEEMRKCIESGLNCLKIVSFLGNELFPIKIHNVFSYFKQRQMVLTHRYLLD